MTTPRQPRPPSKGEMESSHSPSEAEVSTSQRRLPSGHAVRAGGPLARASQAALCGLPAMGLSRNGEEGEERREGLAVAERRDSGTRRHAEGGAKDVTLPTQQSVPQAVCHSATFFFERNE